MDCSVCVFEWNRVHSVLCVWHGLGSRSHKVQVIFILTTAINHIVKFYLKTIRRRALSLALSTTFMLPLKIVQKKSHNIILRIVWRREKALQNRDAAVNAYTLPFFTIYNWIWHILWIFISRLKEQIFI